MKVVSFWGKQPKNNKKKSISRKIKPIKPFNFDIISPKRIKRKDMNWAQAKRKYPKLNPFGDYDRDKVINMFDCKPLDKKRHMPMLYHVTLKEKVPKVKKEGIKYQKKPMFFGTYGQDLRKKGNVYAFKEKNDARRWASKTEWDKKQPVSVVTFDEPDDSERMARDLNPQMQLLGRGSAVRIKGDISPEQIQQVEEYGEDMKQELMKESKKEFQEMEGKTKTIQLEMEDDEDDEDDSTLDLPGEEDEDESS